MDRKPFEIKVHVLLRPSCGISLFPRCNASPFHRAVSRRWIKLKHSPNFLKLWDGDKWASPELQCLEIQLSGEAAQEKCKAWCPVWVTGGTTAPSRNSAPWFECSCNYCWTQRLQFKFQKCGGGLWHWEHLHEAWVPFLMSDFHCEITQRISAFTG